MGIEKPAANPLNYRITSSNPLRVWKLDRSPLDSQDYKSFNISDIWIDKSINEIYMLVGKTATSGEWVRLGGATFGDILALTGDTGGPIGPSGIGNVDLKGGTGINSTGTPASNLITFAISGDVANLFTADSGTAVPSSSNLNILSGVGVDTTAAGNTVTISATGTAWNWQEDTVGIINLVNRTGYFANGGAQIDYDLPATAAQGEDYKIIAKSASGFRIRAGAGQTIRMGNQITTVSGDIDSTQIGDVVEIVCMTANTGFIVMDAVGNILIN